MNLLLNAINGISVLAIMGMALLGLNRMGRHTGFIVRVSYLCAAIGAFSLLVAPLYGSKPPEWPQVMAHSGIAMMFILNRLSK